MTSSRVFVEVRLACAVRYVWCMPTPAHLPQVTCPVPAHRKQRFQPVPSHVEQMESPRGSPLWRPCLRCGSLRSDGTYAPRFLRRETGVAASEQVCPRCFLTICDCDD